MILADWLTLGAPGFAEAGALDFARALLPIWWRGAVPFLWLGGEKKKKRRALLANPRGTPHLTQSQWVEVT